MEFKLSPKAKFLTPDFKKELDKIVKQYEKKYAALLPVLHRVQDEFGWIPREAEVEIAKYLDVTEVRIREVVSFYVMFREKKIGRYHIKVCQTMACHLMGQQTILDYIRTKLNIDLNETTLDKKFTLSTVECLGACDQAPVMQINNDFYGFLTPDKIDEILDQLL